MIEFKPTKLFSSCLVCGNEKLYSLKGMEKLSLVKCKVCNFIFDKRFPDEKELEEYYRIYTYSGLKEVPVETRKSYNYLLDKFDPFKDTCNILDIGCGQGDFLIEAKKRGWNVFGSEFSESAAKLCKEREIKTHEGKLNIGDFEGVEFDVITSFEVIEHSNQPHEFMSAISHLRKGGLFYCTTPNFNSILRYLEKDDFKMISYPEHISYYTKKSLIKLGQLHNLSTHKILTTGLDIGRLKKVFKREDSNQSDEIEVDARKSTDDLRKKIHSNFFLRAVKNIINFFLTLSGTGDTLKVYWIKHK